MLAATALCAAASSDAPVKLSGSGICHEPGSRFYGQTVNFQPFATLDACLRAGGRLPRGVKPMSPPDSSAREAPATANAVGSRTPAADSSSAGTGASVPDETAENVSAAPVAVETEESPRRVAPWPALAAAATAMGGLAWWAFAARATRRRRAEEAADRRRWQDHRLSRYDRADEAKLLLAVGSNRATFERLVEYELSRNPQLAREQAISDAYARWKRDNG